VGDLCGSVIATSDNDCGGQSTVEIPVVAGHAYGLSWRSKSGLTTFPWELSITTGITDDKTLSDEITVFPNPNDGKFTIISNNNMNFKTLEIITTAGVLVTQLNDKFCCSHDYSLKLKPGIYIVRLTSEDNNIISTRLVIK
ncbi:MAG TPA: T9SS type A sorting domain-containing protein, partial [Williamwhitmania sp.]|nr:T9SS type A sorting domain-containing protein [Williamwhitmania sp.]